MMRLALSVLLVLSSLPARAIEVELLPAGPGSGGPRSGARPSDGRPIEVMRGEALVEFDDDVPAAERAARLAQVGAQHIKTLPVAGWSRVRLPAGMPVSAGLTLMRAVSGVRQAEPNYVYRPSRTPNDPSVGTQYHLGNVNAYSAWEYGVGGSSLVTVAVMDTGIEATHPDLQSKLVPGESVFCNPGADKNDDDEVATFPYDNSDCALELTGPGTPVWACNHGTRVAGVAAAATDNGVGVAGMSWGAKLVSIRVFREEDCDTACCSDNGTCCGLNCNTCGTDTSAIIDGLNYARTVLQNKAGVGKVVLNMSIGGPGDCPAGTVLRTAISNAIAAGVVLVAASGNSGGAVESPGNCPEVIPVGATNSSDDVVNFSCRGPELATYGLVAPGKDIVTTDVGGGYTASATGTSFASPLVAGLAALVLSVKPAFTPAQVRDTLRNSTSNIGIAASQLPSGVSPMGETAGAGLANAYSAMRLAITGSTEFDGTRKAIAYPNPFKVSQSGNVTITVPKSLEGTNVSIKIYTPMGQLVRTLRGR
ncbi:MAG: S8 family serine peptidase, partial [Elusimicrobia bacterium]|nr:S8 family serine peptidase [Elusimicrobiota bacterium]